MFTVHNCKDRMLQQLWNKIHQQLEPKTYFEVVCQNFIGSPEENGVTGNLSSQNPISKLSCLWNQQNSITYKQSSLTLTPICLASCSLSSTLVLHIFQLFCWLHRKNDLTPCDILYKWRSLPHVSPVYTCQIPFPFFHSDGWTTEFSWPDAAYPSGSNIWNFEVV
jgi:hypothetical protein